MNNAVPLDKQATRRTPQQKQEAQMKKYRSWLEATCFIFFFSRPVTSELTALRQMPRGIVHHPVYRDSEAHP